MYALLDVVIGLTFVYFLTSMLCSSVMEVIARKYGARGKMLHEGLKSLVPDRWLYLRLINHPMVSGLFRNRPGEGSPPSYLPARNFSIALMDTLLLHHDLSGESAQKQPLNGLKLAVRQAKKDDLSVGHALQSVIGASPDIDTALKEVEKWYDSGMERVSGWYKVYTQKKLFFIGLVVAVFFNIDTIEITTYLARSADLRDAISAAATRISNIDKAELQNSLDLQAELKALYDTGLPIGYNCLASATTVMAAKKVEGEWYGSCLNEIAKSLESSNLILKLLGWLLTAVAVSFGSTFWFDAMKRLVNLRNAGQVPAMSSKSVKQDGATQGGRLA